MKKLLSLFLASVMLAVSLGSTFYAYALDMAHGVDVSEWNGDVDYEYVKEQGNAFVMIRLGYDTILDKTFIQNVEDAVAAGLDFGVYLYSYAYNTKEAEQEADFAIEQLSKLREYEPNFTLPVAYDIEEPRILSVGKCTKAQITSNMTTFCEKIKAAGYVPMVYSNTNWFTNYIDINKAVANGYKIWCADWRDTPSFDKQFVVGNTGVKADMWQYYGVDEAGPTVFDKNVIFYRDDLIKPLPKLRLSIKLNRTSITYTGTVQRPSVTVSDGNGNALVYKKDFTVSYSDWNSTNVGEYKVTVDFIGKYSDTAAKEYVYNIVPLTNVTPKLNRNTITCNGTVQRPTVTVTDAKGNALVYNKDFKVSYSNWNSKDIGRYTVTVTMMGNYSGQKTFPYYINPKPTSFKTSAQGGFKAQSKGFTLSWNKQSDITGYQIQYATRSDFSNGAIIYAGPANATSKTITGRAGNTRYYVRIRTYKNINGSYFYSDWSTGTKSVVTLR